MITRAKSLLQNGFNIIPLAIDILIVYLAYFFCRLAFVVVNLDLYADITATGFAKLFAAGLIFDTSAIIYTNALLLLLFLIPLPERIYPVYQKVVRWIYFVINSICVVVNLMDCVYFQFTGRRTTASVFSEFSNEPVSEMATIFFEQFIAHWALFLFGIAICYLLYRLFLPPYPIKAPRAPKIIVNLLSFCLLVPLCIAGMRGGFTMATRPITISNANQYASRPAETGIVLNTPFSLIRTIRTTSFEVPDYMPDTQAEQLYSPLHQPTDSIAFTPRNVVVIILESFGKQHFGFYNRSLRNSTYAGFTPFLDSLITCGNTRTFKYSYANGRKSIEGMPSVLSSLPNYVEPLFLTPASLNKMSGLARELSENKGYHSAFFHGAINGSMGFQAFARATGFQEYYGRTEYGQDPGRDADKDFDGSWAIWDEEFLQYYADCMSRMPQPFMTAVFTASSHTPFALPDRYRDSFPKGEKPLQQCIAYTDNALRLFFEKASKQPWFANTLFVITADHTSQNIDPCYLTPLGMMSVPIIFYDPSNPEIAGYDTERVVQQIDIMPTVLSYLHYDRPYIAFGQDVIASPADKSMALHWLPESQGYQFVAGDYALQFDGKKITAAYEFRTDSLMRHNVAEQMPDSLRKSMEARMKSVIQQYMQRMTTDRLTVEP